MDLKTLEWKHMGRGDAGKKGGEKRNGDTGLEPGRN